ncbi:LicD family protein [Ectothiorhodospira shaposhnikovii]|uniref:LicD family protein n=1 Tax=Ectothiorhodospira shaposhnikovii TaxID=1054 RepID=UPI0039A2CFEC
MVAADAYKDFFEINSVDFFEEPSFFYEWDFASKNKNIITEGLSGFEEWGCWSNGEIVELKVNKNIICGNFLYVYFRPYINDKINNSVSFVFSAGRFRRTFKAGCSYNSNIHFVKVPLVLLDFCSNGFASINFKILNPRSPSECGSADTRRLGLGFLRLGIGDADIEQLTISKFGGLVCNGNTAHEFDSRIAPEAYRLTYIMQKIMQYFNIRYYFSSGTLLGAARHKGMIPWDDDIDLCLLEDDVDNFESKVVPLLVALGWKVNKNPDPSNWVGFNVVSKNRQIRDYPSPYCDVFIVRDVGSRLVDLKGFLRAKPFYDDVFPTKLMDFGGFGISVPNNHEAVLCQDFGSQWYLSANKYNHAFKQFEMISDEVEEFLPAGPFIKIPAGFE